MKKFIISILILAVLVIPVFALAQDPGNLIPCGREGQASCDFNGFMKLINNVIYFVLFYLAMPIAAVMFAYAGFLLVTSGGNTESRSSAKKIFTDALIGFIIAVAAFLIINTILSLLGYEGDWIGFD